MEDSVEDVWKVVRTRKGKPRSKRVLQGSGSNSQPLSCCAGHGSILDSNTWDEGEEHKLRMKIQMSMERVRSSQFFKILIEQMQYLKILERLLANFDNFDCSHHETSGVEEALEVAPPIAGNEASSVQSCNGWFVTKDGICGEQETGPSETASAKVLNHNMVELDIGDSKLAKGSHNKVEVVVLGVGSILDSEVSRCQISLALLLKAHHTYIERIYVYDPVLSTMECSILTTLGCTPIVQDENGKRRALSPTLFYMPHCGASLYNNLMEVNSDPWCLGWVSVLGNSFQKYQDSWSVFPKPKHVRPDCLLEVQKHVMEHAVNPASFQQLSAFNDMSWHMFPPKRKRGFG